MFAVDLFSQAVYVDFDRVREWIERVVPNMRCDLRARNELARASRQILEQRILFRGQLHFIIAARNAMTRRVYNEILNLQNIRTKL